MAHRSDSRGRRRSYPYRRRLRCLVNPHQGRSRGAHGRATLAESSRTGQHPRIHHLPLHDADPHDEALPAGPEVGDKSAPRGRALRRGWASRLSWRVTWWSQSGNRIPRHVDPGSHVAGERAPSAAHFAARLGRGATPGRDRRTGGPPSCDQSPRRSHVPGRRPAGCWRLQ